MVIDSSAIIAILFQEQEAKAISNAIENSDRNNRYIAAPTLLETRIVLYGNYGNAGLAELDKILEESNIQIIAFTEEQGELAIAGYKRFHQGKKGLNFGDCFSYALAKARNDLLLCKGDDFKLTDISLVQY